MITAIRVLMHFITQNEPLTIRELAKRLKQDYKIVHTAVRQLEREHSVNLQTAGHTILVTKTTVLTENALRAEYQLRAHALQNKTLAVLTRALREHLPAQATLLLFGSYAKGTQTKNSDIDVIAILPDKKYEAEARRALDVLPLPVHLNTFTEEEYKGMLAVTKSNVAHEAQSHRIILHNIESYYALIP